MAQVGQNIDVVVKDSRYLVITIDLSSDIGPSASGKTVLYGSTRGTSYVGDIGLNVSAWRKSGTKNPYALKAKSK